jgi:hypothetical protein
MFANEDDVKYHKIIKTLSSLRRVKTPAGFETDLMRRIYSGNYVEQKTFWDNILSPSRLIPTSALAIAMVIFLLLFNFQTEDVENPLAADPRVREDMILAESVVMNAETVAPDNENTAKEYEEPVLTARRNDTSSYLTSGILTASASNPELVINKSGLNFRQIHLSEEEREQLNKLKEKIKSFWGNPASK